MVLTNDHITNTLKTYFKDKPVNRVWIFGSYARGEADDKSDIDVLVDIEKESKVGLDYFGWHTELAEQLHKNVDVLSYGWVNKHIWPIVQNEMKLIYEK
jgi:uncharacterized protein